MANEEGSVRVTWEIEHFSLLLNVPMWRHLRSPKWVVEDTDGREVLGMLNALHVDSQIKFYVQRFDAQRFRTEMHFMSSCGVVQLYKNIVGSEFDLDKSALFDESGLSVLPNDTMTLRCRMWGKTFETSEFKFITVLRRLDHIWAIKELASSVSHDTHFKLENFKFDASLEKEGNGDWLLKVKEKQCAPGDRSLVECKPFVKDSCGRVLDCRRLYSAVSTFVLDFNTNSTNTSVTLQLELIVALHGRHQLPASSRVARETQLKGS